jgi:hypothetical protein
MAIHYRSRERRFVMRAFVKLLIAPFCLWSLVAVAFPGAEGRGGPNEDRVNAEELAKMQRDAAAFAAEKARAEAAEAAEREADNQVLQAGGKIRVKLSDEQWSGAGRDFSEWYYLQSDPAPPGYRLHSWLFWVVGDRGCGAWAECAQDDEKFEIVKYKFRMQGHDENKALVIKSFYIEWTGESGLLPSTVKADVRWEGRQAASRGVLKTRYIPR